MRRKTLLPRTVFVDVEFIHEAKANAFGELDAEGKDDAAFDGYWQTSEESGLLLHHLGGDRYAALAKSYRA